MRDLVDHAPNGGRVFQLARAVHLVQAKPDQGLAVDLGPANRAADLLDDDGFRHVFPHHPAAASAGAAAAAGASRGGRISATFVPRRAATMRGEFSSSRASKVARIML